MPQDDLVKIERMYIIPKTNQDYRGTYTPILCNIMVEWDVNDSFYNPLAYIFLFMIAKTLYHEIGHHVHDHTFGQIEEQEIEADQYAYKLLEVSYPVFMMFLNMVTRLLPDSFCDKKR